MTELIHDNVTDAFVNCPSCNKTYRKGPFPMAYGIELDEETLAGARASESEEDA